MGVKLNKSTKGFLIIAIVLISLAFIINAVSAYSLSTKNILKNTGFSMKSMSIYNGVFAKNKDNDNVFYGTTIMGSNSMNLFMYDINKSKVVKTINLQGACGSNIMINNNGSVYIGTYSKAAIYKYDINSEGLKKLFELPGEEVSICDMKVYDNKIYIGTFPKSIVYVYDLSSGKLTNLGSMYNLNYVNSIEYNNGKVYAGIGPGVHLIEYDIKNHTKREISLPTTVKKDTFINTLKIINNRLFIGILPSNKVISYDLQSGEFREDIDRIGSHFNQAPDFSPDNTFFTGMSGNIFQYNSATDSLSVLQHNTGVKISDIIDDSFIACISAEGVYKETDFRGVVKNTIDLTDVGFYGPKMLPMFSYASKGMLFFGGKRMAVYDTHSKVVDYKIVPGEPKAIIVSNNTLFTANYTDAKIWGYDMDLVQDSAPDFSNESNLIFNIENQNRPLEMLSTSKGKELVIATDPYYGEYGSAITLYDTDTKTKLTINGITGKQSIKCMVLDKDNPDYLYIGTTIRGTYGNNELNENAHVIKYDLAKRKKLFDIIPDKKNGIIRSIAYEKGMLYFITENEYNLYCVDTKNFKTIKMLKKSHMKELLGSVDGSLYGISEKALWNIDKVSLKAKQLGNTLNYLTDIFEDPVEGVVYFFDNTSLYSYQ
jgi:outer membrane protein assembly factor BamB